MTQEGPRELARRIAAFGPGKRVEISYLRGGLQMTARGRLDDLPEEEAKVAPSRFGKGRGYAGRLRNRLRRVVELNDQAHFAVSAAVLFSTSLRNASTNRSSSVIAFVG